MVSAKVIDEILILHPRNVFDISIPEESLNIFLGSFISDQWNVTNFRFFIYFHPTAKIFIETDLFTNIYSLIYSDDFRQDRTK